MINSGKKSIWLARKQPDGFLSYTVHAGVVEIRTNILEFFPLDNIHKISMGYKEEENGSK
jgi:hypothetical protein